MASKIRRGYNAAMAKKKAETGAKKETSTPAKKPAPAAAPPEKKAAASSAKPAASGSPASSPRIDTSLAANAAAAMIAGKVGPTSSGGKSQPKKESSAFKQLKAGLNKPAGGALGGAFGVVGQQQKKSGQNYGGGKQVGHNQTFGADVNRSGVPRRTPG